MNWRQEMHGPDHPGVGQCQDVGQRLEVADIKKILAQGIHQAQALGVNATIAVTDRVGNVLAVHQMAPQDLAIATEFPPTVNTGLEKGGRRG